MRREVLVVILIIGALAKVPHFPSCSPWYQDVSEAELDPHSSDIIKWFTAAGGFGYGKFQTDFSFHILKGILNVYIILLTYN